MKTGSGDIAAFDSVRDEALDSGVDNGPSPDGAGSIIAGLFKSRAKRLQDYLSFRLRNRQDAEDASQEVFLKLWRREEAGALRAEANAYMYSAALSVATDAERQRMSRARERFVEVELEEIPQRSASQEEQLHWRQAMAHFVYCVQVLPELTRKIFVMHHVEGLHYPAIAKKLGISTRTVERHIAQAFLEVQRQMGDYL